MLGSGFCGVLGELLLPSHRFPWHCPTTPPRIYPNVFTITPNAEPPVAAAAGPSQQRGSVGLEVSTLFTLISLRAFWEISLLRY